MVSPSIQLEQKKIHLRELLMVVTTQFTMQTLMVMVYSASLKMLKLKMLVYTIQQLLAEVK